MHPDGFGNSVMLKKHRHDLRVGMQLWLRMMVHDELACYVIVFNGTDGCLVAFATKVYMTGKRGL